MRHTYAKDLKNKIFSKWFSNEVKKSRPYLFEPKEKNKVGKKKQKIYAKIGMG